MAIDYRFDEDWNCVLTRVAGSPSSADLQAFVEALEADPRVQPDYLRFSDLRALTVAPDAAVVQTFAKSISRLQESKPSRRSAILASQDIYFGMARVYVGHLERTALDTFGVFRDLREALAWLELPPEAGDPFQAGEWIRVVAAEPDR